MEHHSKTLFDTTCSAFKKLQTLHIVSFSNFFVANIWSTHYKLLCRASGNALGQIKLTRWNKNMAITGGKLTGNLMSKRWIYHPLKNLMETTQLYMRTTLNNLEQV
jgi:hypothetical protein